MSEEVKNILDEYIEKFVNKNPSKQSRELFNNIKGKLKKIPSKDLNNLIDFSGHNIVDKKYNAIYFVIEDLIEQTEEYKELKREIKKDGIKEPIIIQFGQNGKMKVGEGNHRHQIATELNIDKIPVRFNFFREVHLPGDEPENTKEISSDEFDKSTATLNEEPYIRVVSLEMDPTSPPS